MTGKDRRKAAATQTPADRCAPVHRTTYEKSGTCLTHDYLKLVASLYNRAHPDLPPIRVSSTKDVLLQQLRKRLGHEMHRPWSELDFMTSDAKRGIDASFRPAKPSSWSTNAHEWLNTDDIASVMSQYERRYRSFKFVGVFPIDFDSKRRDGRCIEDRMCRLDLAELRQRGYSRFGAVFNLDRHDQRGSHWVAMYCGFGASLRRNFGCFYYDSVGRAPPAEVRRLMERMRAQVRAMNGDGAAARFELDYNRTRRQYKNTECGIFAMYFLSMCLPSRAPVFQELCASVGDDEQLHAYRDVFYSAFNTSNSHRR